jgi:hypothetical protein
MTSASQYVRYSATVGVLVGTGTARLLGGEPTPSDESKEVHWVSPSDALGLTMDRSMRIRINDYLRGGSHPVII